MFHLICALSLLIGSFFFGNWKKWASILPTMYYISLMNLFYHHIAHTLKKLWELKKPFLNEFINGTIYTFVTLPSLAFLFLSHYPDGNRKRKTLYFLKWIVASLITEWFFLKMGYIKFYEGYSYAWEFLFYPMMYVMIRLHHRKPGIAQIVSVVIIVILFIIFDYDVL
jgi:hypothetical protein